MSTELISIIGGAGATIVTAIVTALLTRRKYTSETRRTELDNVREGNEILLQTIVKPLEVQIKRLNTNVSRFEKAIAKIPACPHSVDCPVTDELRRNEKGNDGEPADGK